MKAVIIDNELDIRALLEAMLTDFCPEVEIIDQASGVSEGIKVILKHDPELVFLDVEMNDGTGFDLLQKLPSRDFHLIFVTAHDRYALQAFRFSALDYLLKPLNSTELIAAVDRATHAIEAHQKAARIENLLDYIQQPDTPRRIVLKNSESIHIISVIDIISCEADGSYTKFLITGGKELFVSGHLKEYEKLLPSVDFFRVHNSFLINIKHLLRFDKADGGTVVMTNERHLPVSVRKKDGLLKLLSSIG